jgi:hypothetical protein
MFDSLIIAHLFITLGYAFLAVALLVFFLFSRKGPYIAGLARISNGVLAFYSLCSVFLSLALAAKAWGGLAKIRIPWEFVLVLACMAFPYLRRRPLWLLLPFALLVNVRKAFPHNDTTAVFRGLYNDEQTVLWGMCSGYCLLILVLFIISLRIRRLVAEDHL